MGGDGDEEGAEVVGQPPRGAESALRGVHQGEAGLSRAPGGEAGGAVGRIGQGREVGGAEVIEGGEGAGALQVGFVFEGLEGAVALAERVGESRRRGLGEWASGRVG